MNRGTRLYAALAAMLLANVLAHAQQKAGALTFDKTVFVSSKGEKVDAELGHLWVPENRTKAGSRLIRLAFIRFKSTSTQPGPPIVYLAGGPGTSGINTAKGSRFPLFMSMREVADVIALDQRGTGVSEADTACTETTDLSKGVPSREAATSALRQISRACKERLTNRGIDLRGYNTNESADDIDDLRRALGVPKISLWAISYGTHLALATIKRHNAGISRAILAGVEGPEDTIKLPGNIQKHLEDIDQKVKMDPALSAQIPSFLGLMKEVLDRLDQHPETVEIDDPVSKQKVAVTVNRFVVQILVSNIFGSGESSLPLVFYRMSKGDFSQTAQRWLNFSRAASIGSGMSSMMDCYSGISPARRRQIALEAKTALLEDLMDFPFPEVCDAWTTSLGPAFWKPVKTNIPTLFISGTFDVRTPPSNAERVRKGFTNSEHLIIDGAVHSDPLFLSSPKIKDVMLEFMKGQKISTNRIALDPLKFVQIPL